MKKRAAITTLVFLLCVLLTSLFREQLEPSVTCLFLLAVLFATIFSGTVAGLIVAVAGIVTTSYFFMAPFGSFKVYRPSDIFQLVVFVAMAIVVGILKTRKDQAEYWLRIAEEGKKARLKVGTDL
jgi:K+-sensing histidine kinase KdpD